MARLSSSCGEKDKDLPTVSSRETPAHARLGKLLASMPYLLTLTICRQKEGRNEHL